MNQLKGILSIALLCLFVSLTAHSSEQTYEFEDPKKRAMFLELTKELRCPMCQNQNIADSDAMIAHDLRRKVYQLIQQGKSSDEIIEYMKERYGDFVYYQPPVTPTTVWLWVLPIVFVFVAFVFLIRSRKPVANVNEAEKLAEAEKMLESDK